MKLVSFFFIGYIDFADRCDRPTFWAITPIYVICLIGVTLLSVGFEGAPQQLIFWGFVLVTLVPFISLLVRRLHDFNLSGYFAAVLLPIFFIGGVWLFLMSVIGIGLVPATRGTNKFGDDARGGNASVFD